MLVGIPTEIKNNEYRVAITPGGVAELTRRGHEVIIQAGAGDGSAIDDRDFKAAGAEIVNSAEQVWAQADLLLKVKEPIEAEYSRMRKGQTLFTYLHLAASRAVHRRADDIGHHLDRLRNRADRRRGAAPAGPDERGGRPALGPGRRLPPDEDPGRSRCADGRRARCGPRRRRRHRRRHCRLQRGTGGQPAWARSVTIFDININRLRELDAEFGGKIHTRYSSAYDLEAAAKQADLVIGAVLVPGRQGTQLWSPIRLSHR